MSNKLEVLTETLTDRVTYIMCEQNQARGRVYDENGVPRPDQKYPATRMVLNRSSLVWPEGLVDPFSGKPRSGGKYLLRYYDGCTTLFMDDQPKDAGQIELLMSATRPQAFINGYLRIDSFEKMLLKYLDWASWNLDSPYRNPRIEPIYKQLDAEKSREEKGATIDDIEMALEFAKKAKPAAMMVHAYFLEIQMEDHITRAKLSEKAIRSEYREAAMKRTKKFLETYHDKSLHAHFWIKTALENGEISSTKVPNKAVWGKKGVVICDISGLTSQEGILNKLIEFSQTEDGKDFAEQLKASYG